MSDIEENAYQLAKYLVEARGKHHGWEHVRQELKFHPDEFEKAYDYLHGFECCRRAGRIGDDATIIIENGLYGYFEKARSARVDISPDSEALLRYLIKDQTVDTPYSAMDYVISNLGWDRERYLIAAQELEDDEFITQSPAANNYYMVKVEREGRKAVKNNFKIQNANNSNAMNIGRFTANFGNHNIVNIGAILTSVQQNIHESPAIPDDRKEELERLLDSLEEALSNVPQEQAEIVAESAKELVEKATTQKPNRRFIEIKAENLKKAAQDIKDIAPAVLTTASLIINLILSLP